MTLSHYAKDNDLLEKTGWKRFKRIAQRDKKKYIWMVRQARAAQVSNARLISLVFEFPGLIVRPLRLIMNVATVCGKRPLTRKWSRLWNTRSSVILERMFAPSWL